MTANIYTMNVSEADASQRLSMLLGGDIEKPLKTILIDLRFFPQCTHDPAWSGKSLYERWGRKYYQLGMYLGDMAYESGGPFRFRDAPNGLHIVSHYLGAGTDVVLLCDCGHDIHSHLSIVAEMTRVAMLVEVTV